MGAAKKIEAAPRWLSTGQVAKTLGTSVDTLRRWCERGYFPDAYQAPGGHWRIPEGDVLAFHDRRKAGR